MPWTGGGVMPSFRNFTDQKHRYSNCNSSTVTVFYVTLQVANPSPMVVRVLISLKPDHGSDPNRGAPQTTVHHDTL